MKIVGIAGNYTGTPVEDFLWEIVDVNTKWRKCSIEVNNFEIIEFRC
jgi:hypothetical protein